jgi:hypothetical protein
MNWLPGREPPTTRAVRFGQMGSLAGGHCRRMPAREEICDYIRVQEAAALQCTDCPPVPWRCVARQSLASDCCGDIDEFVAEPGVS